MNRIAFTLPDVGLREIRGMAFVDEGYLVLRIENALLGMVDTEKSEIKIEPKALRAIEIKRGVFRNRLILTPKRMDLLDLVPGDHVSAVELKVQHKYRRELERLIADVQALR